MGWSKAARPGSVPCSSPPGPLESQEEGLAGQQMALGGGAARQTDDCQDRWRAG